MAVAVVYGAGNVGRGFIGMLLAQSGYSVTFIDVDKKIVDALNGRGKYPVRTLPRGGAGDIWVENVSAIDGADTEAAAKAIASADIMASSVGARVLPAIAPVIAEGIRLRLSETGRPLDILICENLAAANEKLAAWLVDKGGLSADTVREKIGLVETAIARMIPVQDPAANDGDPLMVSAEPYAFLPVAKDAFAGSVPQIKGMIPFENFERYVSRKLYIHNMGHAVCAYFGILAGDEYIYGAVRRSGVRYIAKSAMLESAMAISSEYDGMPLGELLVHIDDLIKRFANTALIYSCERAGADTARKLGGSDRFIGAALLCRKNGVASAFIEAGAAAALKVHMDRNEAVRTAETAERLLTGFSGLSRDTDGGRIILNGIMDKYKLIEGGAGADELSLIAAEEAAGVPVI